jgi:glycosyltransferase involved in cell wall biosynthesis
MQTLNPSFFEIIVTDDSNNFESRDYLQLYFPQVKWMKGPRKGPASNRNSGAKHCSGIWLVFIDDDCLPQNDCLQIYYNAILNNPEIKVFEGAIHPTNWDELTKDLAECPVNTIGDNFWSANVCVEKELFF